jgi:hypothetical protein
MLIVGILDHEEANDRCRRSHGHLQEEAEAPSERIGNEAIQTGSAGRAKANDDVLDGLVHAAMFGLGKIGIDDSCCTDGQQMVCLRTEPISSRRRKERGG